MSKTGKKGFRFFKERDHRVFLVSLLIAFVFWFAIKFSRSYTYNYDFQVSYQIPDSLSFTDLPPEKLRVQLVGQGWDLLEFSFRKHFDELSVRTGKSEVSQSELIHALEIHIANPSITIEKVSEASLELSLEESAEKKVPVDPVLNYTLEKGFTLQSKVMLQPDSILVMGPASIIKDLGIWKTQEVNLGTLKTDVSIEIPLQIPKHSSVSLGSKSVHLVIPVEQLTEKFIKVPVKLTGESLHQYRIHPEVITLQCVVGMSKYGELNAGYFSVVARIPKDSKNITDRHIPVEIAEAPDFIASFDYHPKTVEVFKMDESDK